MSNQHRIDELKRRIERAMDRADRATTTEDYLTDLAIVEAAARELAVLEPKAVAA